MPKTLLVTGGAGFIGANFVLEWLAPGAVPAGGAEPVLVLDALTYAGNLANLAPARAHPGLLFERQDICNGAAVLALLRRHRPRAIVHFAAETHVDRSILEPEAFLRTDILGTHVLLEAARERRVPRFLQVSTDEVYGDVQEGESRETDPLRPRSPYAASKAGADLQVLAYATTYETPVLITRGSNTYGPYQYPEKLIPLFVTNLIDDQPVPVYGDGLQQRDWLHVDDHARGILHVLEHGSSGEVYNLGGGNRHPNLEITKRLVSACGRAVETHVKYVLDRPGHDRRYALDCARARALGWEPQIVFDEGLAAVVRWYQENEGWWRPIKSGAFREYYARQYAAR